MANETSFSGGSQPVAIAAGYTLTAPGLSGKAQQTDRGASTSGTRSALRAPQPVDKFDLAFSRANAQLAAQFELTLMGSSPPAPPTVATRGAQPLSRPKLPEAPLELATPTPPPNMGSVVLHTDENGEMHWIWPSRKEKEKTYFHLPRPSTPPPPKIAAGRGERGAIIAGIRQVVKVITWATDDIIGDLALNFARQWEEKHRPYGFHYVQPGKFGGEVPWGQLEQGRSLLLLHGTFSTGDGAFSGLIYSDWLRKMAAYYGGRIFAFNHPSLYHSPAQNIEQLRKMLPSSVKNLKLDIVTHSRGGLVGRELAERFSQADNKDKRIEVKRAVLVAGPNSGTILTDRQHWSTMIDTYTNLLVGLPDNVFTLLLEGILTIVKLVGGGAVHGLPGLQAMLPGGDYIKTLNQSPKTKGQYYALAAQYMPNDEKFMPRLGKTVLVQALRKLFGEDSDMVVPTQGCYALNPHVAGFSIPNERYKVYGPSEDTHHLNFFQKEAVNRQLHDWLTAPAGHI